MQKLSEEDFSSFTPTGKKPIHVAFIMDGNGRWAEKQGKERSFGHQNGILPLKEMVQTGLEIGISYLTFYAFSTENWSRPQGEIDHLMELLAQAIVNEAPALKKQGIRFQIIGDWKKLPAQTVEKLEETINLTFSEKNLTLILALNYGGKQEILQAVNAVLQNGQKEIDLEGFEKYLQTSVFPAPDLLIRTAGEQRLSNFLLWQSAYSELYFSTVLWPDFRKKNFLEALGAYQNRKRKFGGLTSE